MKDNIKKFIKCKYCTRLCNSSIPDKLYCVRNGYIVTEEDKCHNLDLNIPAVLEHIHASSGISAKIITVYTSKGIEHAFEIEGLDVFVTNSIINSISRICEATNGI